MDRAESEPELAMQVNGIAPGIMAEEARRSDALLVHYSTDYVFDGAQAADKAERAFLLELAACGGWQRALER